jgi:hypothetical protein
LEDIFSPGNRYSGSCQNIHGDPQFNKGVAANLQNLEIQGIVVKTKKGSILARAIMRLTWDDKNQKHR